MNVRHMTKARANAHLLISVYLSSGAKLINILLTLISTAGMFITFPLCEQLCIFSPNSLCSTLCLFLRKVQVQVQVYFSLFKLVQYKMAYRISRLTNDEKYV